MKSIEVLNIANYAPVHLPGFARENDIYYKIYKDLETSYRIKSKFIKPVTHLPECLARLKENSYKRKNSIKKGWIRDPRYGMLIRAVESNLLISNQMLCKHSIVMISKLNWRIYKRKFLKIANDIGPDVIHSHGLYPDGFIGYMIATELDLPLVLTLRGQINYIYYSKIGRQVLERASSISTPSFNMYSNLKKQYPIKIIPHSVDSYWFENSKRCSLDPGKYKLVTVAGLQKIKNIDIVLRTIKRLISDGLNIDYKIIGDGEERQFLEKAVFDMKMEDHVKFCGHLNHKQIKEVFNEADIFVMLSYPETFGRAYFEAAASGLLVIGTKGTGAYGHFSEKEGIFISPDENELYQVLHSLTEEKFLNKTKNAKNLVKEMAVDNINKAYYDFLVNAMISK